MPMTSLPSPYGVGTMGREAFRFVDFLAAAGQKYWQLLPLGPTGYGDSPYSSYSSFAGNPYLIDLDLLIEEGLLTREEVGAYEWGDDPARTDYGRLYDGRYPLLRKAFDTVKIFYISLCAAIAGYAVLLVEAFTNMGNVYLLFIPAFFIFSANGLLSVLTTIFLANSVEYGELKNNRRDESVIFSMQTFVVKLASGIAALAASISLSVFNISASNATFEAVDGSLIAGLRSHLEQIAENGANVVSGGSVIGLRFVMTVLPVVVLFIALMVFKARYVLTDEKLSEISAQIKERRGAESN